MNASFIRITVGTAALGAAFSLPAVELPSGDACAHYRAQAARRVAEIRATPNRAVPAGADARYLAETGDDAADGRTPATAWRTVARLNKENLAPGAWVLFKRGGTYRGCVMAKPGVTYTAYGVGPKPCIYGSPADGADPAKWTRTDNPRVWAYDIGHDDVGTMVFDGGEFHAIKVVLRTVQNPKRTYSKYTGRPFSSYRDLDTDLHFWHDYYKDGTGKVYLYSERNPGERFRSIEFNVKTCGFRVGRNPDVTIDNFCIKYVGIHGVSAGTCRGLHVGNCEFGWIGGSIQGEAIFGRDHPTRLGNAVEVYGGCEDYSVTNCYIWQVYDAGVTHQVNVPRKMGLEPLHQKNVLYADNVMEKCNYSIEYFLTAENGNPSRMEHVRFLRNLLFDAGYGFCEQRPDRNCGAHIKAWYCPTRNRATDFEVRDNVFCMGRDVLLDACTGLRNLDGSSSLARFYDNVVIGREGDLFGAVSETSGKRRTHDASTQAFLDTLGTGNRSVVLPAGRY